MMLPWKRILTVEIDHTHEFLPPAQIKAFHPLDFHERLPQDRPHMTSRAVLVLKHPNPMLGSFWMDIKMAELAAFIVNQEKLDPLKTIFVFDCSNFLKTDWRQLVFEWRKHSGKSVKNGVKWTAHRILDRARFKSGSLEDFFLADRKLFKSLWERQKRILESKSKAKPRPSLFLLMIDGEEREDFSFESVCHLAVEIDAAQPGENYRPKLLALCGARGEWQRRGGTADDVLRAFKEDERLIPYLLKRHLEERTTFCKECEQIGKLPSHRRREHIKKMNFESI